MDGLRIPVSESGEYPPAEPALEDPSARMVGSGTAAGVEASWSWGRGPLSTVGSYRWSRATRTVENMTYTPRFHRDHELELGAALETGRSMWSARFSLRSGQPTTRTLAAMPIGDHDHREWGDILYVVFMGDYNAERLPAYVRLDLGWRRMPRESRDGGRSFTPFVSVANLFSVPNVVAGNPLVDHERDDVVRVERHYLPQMPMLVFFGLEFGF